MTVRQPGHFIARTLLRDSQLDIELLMPDQSLARAPDGAGAVVFIDALHREETVRRSVAALQELGHRIIVIIAVIDVRPVRTSTTISNCPLTLLLSATDFDADEVADPAKTRRLQTDAITNEPLEYAPSEFSELAPQPLRINFLRENAHLFCIGHHYRSGRTHTLALPTRDLIAKPEHREFVCAWIAREIHQGCESLGLQPSNVDIVLFHEDQAVVRGLVPHLLPHIRAQALFAVAMPVEHRGPRSIFQRRGADTLVECKPLDDGFGFAARSRPAGPFLAVYLGDSAVTGNSVREFLQTMTGPSAPGDALAAIAVVVVNRLSPSEVRFFHGCQQLARNGGPSLPFRYRYLFNLQIRSQTGELSVEQPALWSAVDDAALRVGELAVYLERLAVRAASSSRFGLRHHFHTAPAVVPISYEAVRLRQLLSLSQQNEPISSELHELLRQVTTPATQDPSIMVVLALESELLREPPLNVFWQDAITSLAIRIVTGHGFSSELKSDALAVLAGYSGAIPKALPTIIAPVLACGDLRWQLAVHLLAGPPQPGGHAETSLSLAGLLTVDSDLRAPFERLQTVVATCVELQKSARDPQRERTNLQIIRQLFESMSHHADSWMAWDSFNFQLFNASQHLPAPPTLAAQHTLRETAWRVADFAKSILMPGFTALAYYAARSNVRLGRSLSTASAEARRQLEEFERCIPAAPNSPWKDLAKAHQAYETMRKAIWWAPHLEDIISVRQTHVSTGPLAQALPQILCDPLKLLNEIGARRFPHLAPFNAPARELVTIAPVPVDTWAAIAELLVDNISRHGDPASTRLNLSVPPGTLTPEGSFDWTLTLTNTQGPRKEPGGRRGLPIARQHALAAELDFRAGWDSDSKQWHVRITFPRCFLIRPAKSIHI